LTALFKTTATWNLTTLPTITRFFTAPRRIKTLITLFHPSLPSHYTTAPLHQNTHYSSFPSLMCTSLSYCLARRFALADPWFSPLGRSCLAQSCTNIKSIHRRGYDPSGPNCHGKVKDIYESKELWRSPESIYRKEGVLALSVDTNDDDWE
jgi:hypothetical protein